ncbi:hypothetical protein C8F04DRAFT_601492 [Mycena alexandri]|uniref:Uncharacterized protein n=1 Tax=Mycena alexandri TaxID=1745969 RepID=A0AAD6X2C6_9AGAR|nr:hypothetical protein C8F04DRAFT_601492 [Mycena alexandri]
MFGRGHGWMDPYGIGMRGDPFGYDDFGDGIGRSSFAPVSGRAYKALDQAKSVFLKHLASVDTRAGPVKTEIITFHLVPDMKKEFNKYVKEYGCTASQRKITREEQDKINKTRKSLMVFSSVTVSPEAQQTYLAKNPAAAASKNAEAGSSKSAIAPDPLGTSQSLKRSANAAHMDETAQSGSKKKKL